VCCLRLQETPSSAQLDFGEMYNRGSWEAERRIRTMAQVREKQRRISEFHSVCASCQALLQVCFRQNAAAVCPWVCLPDLRIVRAGEGRLGPRRPEAVRRF
jgi:hypothetical protein